VKNILSVGRGDKILLENSSSCQVDVNAKQVAICQKYLGYVPARRPKIQKSPNCRQFSCLKFRRVLIAGSLKVLPASCFHLAAHLLVQDVSGSNATHFRAAQTHFGSCYFNCGSVMTPSVQYRSRMCITWS
jgi:hypothetical protein